MQLVLGTMRLEEAGNAVTAEQAKSLLPLWQSLQGGVTAQAEVSAVLKQIESTMTHDQLAAIAAMRLTQEDLQSWMQEQGMGGGFPGPGGGPGLSSDEMATRQAEFGNMSEEDRENVRATMEAGGGFPGGGQFGNMSEEDRENMRATMEAGGGPPGGGQFGNMSEEERESLRATREAGGGGMGGGTGAGRRAGGMGLFGPMLNPLIELLTQRAGE
jgi:hypothetical protein